MESDYEYVYVHGFLSSVRSAKGLYFQARYKEKGIYLHQLDANFGKGYETSSITLGLEALEDYYKSKGEKPLRIIGASMGAFIAANYAAKYPSHVDRLIFLSGAFNLKEAWRAIADAFRPFSFDAWKKDGVIQFKTFETREDVLVSFSYVEDSLKYPSFPILQCPALSLFGSHDILFAPEVHCQLRDAQKNQDLVKLIELDDAHVMRKPESLERQWTEISRFFA